MQAIRNQDCDYNYEGKMRFCASIENADEVLDYVYFDTENDCFVFIDYYSYKK